MGVVCRQLVKRYENGKLAVKGLDLVMLKNEITCLLGSNGAGTVFPHVPLVIFTAQEKQRLFPCLREL